MTNQDLRDLLTSLTSAQGGQNPVLSVEEVAAFESKHGITLPSEYRSFLLEVGNGVRGRFGLFQLGFWNDVPLLSSELARLAEEFDEDEAEACDDVQETIAGLLPISDAGCSSCYSLVIGGKGAGHIWYDNRVDGSFLEPVVDDVGQMGFRAWYGALLTART